MTQPAEHEREIRYFVNGEAEKTRKHNLKVREILEHAGFTPVTDYTLKSEEPKKDFDSHYDEEVHIREDQRFRATHRGPTPTS